eukprot:g17554.t1
MVLRTGDCQARHGSHQADEDRRPEPEEPSPRPIQEPVLGRMDLLANGARHVVVPRYVQTERATQLAEFAVVFRLTELRDAPPGVRGARYACQHEVLKPVRITRVLNPEDFAKKHTYLRESLREDLQELAMLGRAMPLRRWEYMSDRLGRCRLVDHGPTFSEGTLNLASARRENFWEFVQLWQGHCDRRAVALRQQFERDMQEVRASGDPKRAQMLQELEEAYEVEVQHHWAQSLGRTRVGPSPHSSGQTAKPKNDINPAWRITGPRAPSLDQLFSPRTRSPEALELRAAEARSLERGWSMSSLASCLCVWAVSAVIMEDSSPGVSALERLRSFLIESCGSLLQAWLKYFDTNVDYRIDKLEFMEGMRQLSYPASEIPQLFAEIDVDRSEEITLDELDKEDAVLWHKFRVWSVQTFYNDMIETLAADPDRPAVCQACEVTFDQFREGLQRLDWKEGDEGVLFKALDFDGDGLVKPSGLRWLAIELKRLRKKRVAKENAAKKKMPGISWELLERQFLEFRDDLRKRFGNGSLDESGFASIDELDPKGAQVLAHFKKCLDERFASIADAFTFLDLEGTRKIRKSQFEAALRRLEFPYLEPWWSPWCLRTVVEWWSVCGDTAAELFESLDVDGNHLLEEDDIQFLEKWSPSPILTAQPNVKARDEVKEALLLKQLGVAGFGVSRYGRPVKAWRHLLDRDGSNRCNWHEFLNACKIIGFKGDVAGAWRAFDEDLSGYITLKELDREGYRTLWDFRTPPGEGTHGSPHLMLTNPSQQAPQMEEMQQKVLAMEEAEELLKTWKRPVESPMKLVKLCRTWTGRVAGMKHFKQDALRTIERPGGAVILDRLAGPDFCLRFFLKQMEPASETRSKADRSSRGEASQVHLPRLEAPVSLELEATPPEASVREDAARGDEVHHEEVRHGRRLPKPTLDDLLALPRSFAPRMSRAPGLPRIA